MQPRQHIRLVASAVDVLAALETVTEATFRTPVIETFATTLPSVPLNSTKGADALLEALNTAASS
jgi:hypothetical protein